MHALRFRRMRMFQRAPVTLALILFYINRFAAAFTDIFLFALLYFLSFHYLFLDSRLLFSLLLGAALFTPLPYCYAAATLVARLVVVAFLRSHCRAWLNF